MINASIFISSVGLPDKEMTAMELGLAHSLSRYKLKFSPDKIDTMIVQVRFQVYRSNNVSCLVTRSKTSINNLPNWYGK